MDDATVFLERANKIVNRDRQVFLAYDARQAVELMEHLGGAAALVNLDLKGNAGLLVLQDLRASFPDLPIIVISSVLGVP